MTIRSRRETVTFKHPFRIRGIERILPAGAYGVVTDEETIEGLTFSAYRRVATMITVPAETGCGRMEMLSIGSIDRTHKLRTRASSMTDLPIDLDKRRGLAAPKATDLRRALADVEADLREVREREADLENRTMTVPAASWPEAAVKARHLLNLYAAGLLRRIPVCSILITDLVGAAPSTAEPR
jgi:hypothetical protein